MSRFGNLLPMLLAALLAGTLSVSSVAADDDDADGSFSLVANLTGDRTPDGQTDWSPVPEYRFYLPLFVYRWEHAR